MPILDSQIKQRVLEYFDIQLHDNVKARIMNSDGIYERAVDSSAKCCSQEKFIAMAYEAAPQAVTAQPVQTVQVPEPQPVQTPEPAAEVKQPEPQEKPKPATEPEPQPVQTAEPVQAPEPQQAPAAEPVVQTPPQPQKAAEPPVEQAVQPPQPTAPVQYAQPIDPLPIPQPQPEKKGLWARIKAFFSFKK